MTIRSQSTLHTGPTTIIDVEDADTSLLLHFNGANGSSTFTDSSVYRTTVTRVAGSGVISTADYKFGGSSFNSDNSSSLRATSQNLVMGTGDFTYEMWVNPSAYGNPGYSDYATMLIDTRNAADNYGFCFGITSGGYVYLFINASELFRSTGTVPLNVWTHIAIVRSSGVITCYINGSADGSGSSSNNFIYNNPVIIGSYDTIPTGFYKMTGYLDELRITKGVARYTSGFTPAATEFFTTDETKLPSSPAAGQLVYANVGKTAAYICTDPAGPTWKRFTLS